MTIQTIDELLDFVEINFEKLSKEKYCLRQDYLAVLGEPFGVRTGSHPFSIPIKNPQQKPRVID